MLDFNYSSIQLYVLLSHYLDFFFFLDRDLHLLDYSLIN